MMMKPTKISGYEFVYGNQFNKGHATTRVANNANNVAGDGIIISTMEPNLRMKTKGPATWGTTKTTKTTISPAGDDIIMHNGMRTQTTAKRPEISISTSKILYVEIILMCVPTTRTND